ncbi:Dynactin subunit 2 [Wickerhamiella sorbophila]|uniref:Dynactin subunit 2 n=1 Tax=Wickerhamiella sorbophila TaxID=45607 RepID=A0A2T0FM47_9ASCO|nr:Dynactin subunit 2 [Wickerhamiella sorbophila]PRT56047.1 Dynactin subunit 2 [Wickerhamiella sorbophila]
MTTLHGDEVVVYETPDVPDGVDDDLGVESIEVDSDSLDRTVVSREDAFEAFVTVRDFSGGAGLDAKIADIQSQIEYLRLEHSDSRLNDLAKQLSGLASASQPSPLSPLSSPAGSASDSQTRVEQLPGTTVLPLSPQAYDRIARLEARISDVEASVGVSSFPVPLATAVKSAQEKLDLLSSNESQLESALLNLQKLAEFVKKTPVNDKIARIYDTLVSLDPVIKSLPKVISRLESLQVLHADASYCRSTMKDIDATLESMKIDIDRWISTLDALEPKLHQAIETTGQNVEKVESLLS